MTDMTVVSELPFPVTSSQPDVWRRDGQSAALVASAAARTDLYINPAGPESADAESTLNAATLLGTPPDGDFQLSARVSVDFQSKYDAGVLLVWIDEQHWGKLCFEFSPAAQPMVVSVVTLGVSDDANAFVVPERSIWLRISRIGRVYAFHAATDGTTWQLVRAFSLGHPVTGHTVGFEAQSPAGDGCTVTFDQIGFSQARLEDLRDGS
jgi:regulation of enolase protein 1 (concanavalin A-like superfamily)